MKITISDYPCPKCGSITEDINEELTIGVKCNKCNWSVVTTYIPPIEQDLTIYTINIKNGNHQDRNHIKLISKIAEINFLQARTLLEKENPIIFKGRATETKKIKLILDIANISTYITPKFHW